MGGEKSVGQVSGTPQLGLQWRCARHNLGTPGGDALTVTSSLTGEIISHHRGAARAVHPSLDHHAGRAPFVVAGHQGLPLGYTRWPRLTAVSSRVRLLLSAQQNSGEGCGGKVQILRMDGIAWKDLTADNLAIRGWLHDPICKLCRIHPETVQHIALECSLSKRVREKIFTWNGQTGAPSRTNGKNLNELWDETIAGIPKERRREASGLIIYSTCGVWKERNRRTF